MPNRAYIEGRRFEYKVERYLQTQGWTVYRFAASKPIDLLATKRGKRPVIIECKKGQVPSTSERSIKAGEYRSRGLTYKVAVEAGKGSIYPVGDNIIDITKEEVYL